MVQYAGYILMTPLVAAFLYMLIIALKKQTSTDQFFSNYDLVNKDVIIWKLEYLEKLKQLDLSDLKDRIHGLKQRHLEYFAGDIDEALASVYFDLFRDNWISFRKANWGLKLIFFLGLLTGFYAFGLIIYSNLDEGFNKWVIIIPIIMFPLSMLLSFIYIMFISIFMTVFRFLAPKRGSVVRSCVLFNRMIRAAGPGSSGSGYSNAHRVLDFLNPLV
jgi:hypothetical protein